MKRFGRPYWSTPESRANIGTGYSGFSPFLEFISSASPGLAIFWLKDSQNTRYRTFSFQDCARRARLFWLHGFLPAGSVSIEPVRIRRKRFCSSTGVESVFELVSAVGAD